LNFVSHTVFGLSLRSNVSIPGLKSIPPPLVAPDLEVHFGLEPCSDVPAKPLSRSLLFESAVRTDSGAPSLQIWQVSPEAMIELEYYDGLKFWIDGQGRNVWAKWPETLAMDDVAAYLVGPVLGLVLQLRGMTCLHASAVAFGDYAVAFAGGDGAGKSTTAAAFAARGQAVISDDVVALVEKNGAFYVAPAYPHLSLWQDSVELLYGPNKKLPSFSRNLDKRRLALDANSLKFADRPMPLAAIFILGERSADDKAPYVEPLSPREALLNLVANSFAGHLLDKGRRASEFELLGRLVSAVLVVRLKSHKNPARIQPMCDLVTESISQSGPINSIPTSDL
jgi:hypothetical protein